jgi:hypothetical protein
MNAATSGISRFASRLSNVCEVITETFESFGSGRKRQMRDLLAKLLALATEWKIGPDSRCPNGCGWGVTYALRFGIESFCPCVHTVRSFGEYDVKAAIREQQRLRGWKIKRREEVEDTRSIPWSGSDWRPSVAHSVRQEARKDELEEKVAENHSSARRFMQQLSAELNALPKRSPNTVVPDAVTLGLEFGAQYPDEARIEDGPVDHRIRAEFRVKKWLEVSGITANESPEEPAEPLSDVSERLADEGDVLFILDSLRFDQS